MAKNSIDYSYLLNKVVSIIKGKNSSRNNFILFLVKRSFKLAELINIINDYNRTTSALKHSTSRRARVKFIDKFGLKPFLKDPSKIPDFKSLILIKKKLKVKKISRH